MRFISFLFLHYLLTCLLYRAWETQTVFSILIPFAPFFYSFISFTYLEKAGLQFRQRKVNAAALMTLGFYGSILLMIFLLRILPEFLSYDQYVMLLPVILSFNVVFILKGKFRIADLSFLAASFILSYYFIRSGIDQPFFFANGQSLSKGDPMALGFLSASFVSHFLFIIVSTASHLFPALMHNK